MLVLKFATETPLAESSEEFGLVTRMDVTIREFDSTSTSPVGSARVAVIHCGEALNHGISIHDVLDQDSEELDTLDEILFEDGLLKEDYCNGVGSDVLYFEDLELQLDWHGHHVEEAIVRRILDDWGQGCAIGVLPINDADEAIRWKAMGFEIAQEPSGAEQGYMYIDLSLRHPRVLQADDKGHSFRIVDDDPV